MNKCVLLLTLILINVPVSFTQNKFWGVTSKGGSNNAGTIFSTDMQGKNLTTRYHAELLNNAYLPSEFTAMAEHPDTKEIYFVTEEGGNAGLGGLFSFNPVTGNIDKKIDFSGPNGKRPHGGLLFASNKKLYGTTKDSDADTDYPNGTGGCIFEYNPATQKLSVLHKFSDTDGKNPYATLFEASDGHLYGTTSGGGANSKGVLFKYDLSGSTCSVIHSFTTGKAPYGGVTEVQQKLYGATSLGGASDKGILYEYDLNTTTFSAMVHFTSAHSGYMTGNLVEANGILYGVTNGNQQVTGAYGKLIQYIPGENTCTPLHSFMIFTSGIYPIGSLCKVGNTLVGTVAGGPLTPRGSLFEYNLDAASGSEFTYTALSSLSQIDLKGTLLQSSNGIFGMTKSAGISNNGSIYTYKNSSSPKGIEDVASFKIDGSGSHPVGKVTRASNGKLYGNMQSGGKNRSGVLFTFDEHTQQYDVAYDFPTDSRPNGSMVLIGNHRLYGMSETGGDYNQGYIFEYNTQNSNFSILHHFTANIPGTQNFDQNNLGANPKAGFTVVADSILYGTTSRGGFSDEGLLFTLTASKHNPQKIQKLVSFDELTGSEPAGDLAQLGDYLYGMTYNGGSLVPGGGQGTVFRYKIGGSYEPLVAFKGGEDGAYPMGTFTPYNQKLYGFTHGKQFNPTQLGVLFEYNPTNLYTHSVLHSFVGSATEATSLGGSKPYGKMTLSTNGKLYGTTSEGSGTSATGGDYGVIFEFDPSTNVYKSITTFTGENGASPGVNAELAIICAADASATVNATAQSIVANEEEADAYQWYRINLNNDQRTLIQGAHSREFYPEVSGTYSVEVEKAGCSNHSDYYYVEVQECAVNTGVNYDQENNVFTALETSADSYQWYFATDENAELLPVNAATDRSYIPTQTGFYAVEIGIGKCTDMSARTPYEHVAVCNIDTTLNFDADLLILTANESNAVYQWYEKELNGTLTLLPDENQRVFTPSYSGTFLVHIEVEACTAYSQTFNYVHEINCQTNASVSYDYNLKLFVANEANASAYQWYAVDETTEALTALSGETKRTFAPTQTGSYKAEVTKNGCSNFSETYLFKENAICNTNATAAYNTNLNIFIASEANASAYQWYELVDGSLEEIPNETGRAYTPKHTGEYVVGVTKNNCTNYSDPMLYEHVSVCTTDASASFNEGLKIFIANEPNAEKYQWFEVDTDGGLLILAHAVHRTYTPVKSAMYKLEVTKNGCSNFSEALEYDINANCQTDASIVFKSELQLYIANEPNAHLYQWYEETAQGLVAISGETGRSFSPSATGYYVLEVSNNGCSNLSETVYFERSDACTTVAAIYYRSSNHALEATETNADRYQWLMDDGTGSYLSIPGATARVYFPTQSGNYKVAVTKNACEKTSEPLEYAHFVECTLTATVSIDNSGTQLQANAMAAAQYQWYEWNESEKSMRLLQGETKQTYAPEKTGQYLVEIRVDNCADFSAPVYFEYLDPCSFEPIANLHSESGTIALQHLNDVQAYAWYALDATGQKQLQEGANSAQFMPTFTGTYLAKVTLLNNCVQFSNEVYYEAAFVCEMPEVNIRYNAQILAFKSDYTGEASFQWYSAATPDPVQMKPVSGATHATYAPNETGYYMVKISTHETCFAFSQALKYQKPGENACDVYAMLTVNEELHTLVANDMGDVTYEWLLLEAESNTWTTVATTSTYSYSPDITGTYAVKINDGSCFEISEEVFFEAPTDVAETLAGNTLRLYPNPATDILNIESQGDISRIQIISLSGNLMQQYEKSQLQHLRLKVGGLENGIYFVAITYRNGQRTTAKFTKQNK